MRPISKPQLMELLAENGWSVSQASRAIGVKRQQLQRDLRPFGGAVSLKSEWDEARNGVAAATGVAGVGGVAGATRVAGVAGETLAESGALEPATLNESTTSEPLRVSPPLPTLGSVSAPEPVKSATIELSYSEWLWLRRRGEREAKLGGDSSIRGQIRALLAAARAKEEAAVPAVPDGAEQ